MHPRKSTVILLRTLTVQTYTFCESMRNREKEGERARARERWVERIGKLFLESKRI